MKKIITLYAVITLAAAFILSGCGNQKEEMPTEPGGAENADGNELASLDISETFLQLPDTYISDVLTDEEGNYYVNTMQEIYILKPDGSIYSQITPNQYINSIFRMGNGKIGAACFDDTLGFIVNKIIPGENTLKPINSSLSFDYETYQGGADTDLLYTENGVLLSCNLSDEKPGQ